MTFCADVSHAILWEGFALCSLWTRKSYTSNACPAYVLQSPVLSLGTAVDTQVGGKQLRAARAVVLLLWASWKSNWPSIRQDINHTFPGVWEYVFWSKKREKDAVLVRAYSRQGGRVMPPAWLTWKVLPFIICIICFPKDVETITIVQPLIAQLSDKFLFCESIFTYWKKKTLGKTMVFYI